MLLHRVATEEYDASAMWSDVGTLTLKSQAMTKLQGFAVDESMEGVWKSISPGKKAPATGSAGGSSQAQITDSLAALRAAVA